MVNDFECVDCAFDTLEGAEYYMVYDAIWEAVGMETHGGMLCIGCLEKRLGRALTPADFTDYPINTETNWARSTRLRDRLGYVTQEVVVP